MLFVLFGCAELREQLLAGELEGITSSCVNGSCSFGGATCSWFTSDEAGLGFVGLTQLQAQLSHLEDGEVPK